MIDFIIKVLQENTLAQGGLVIGLMSWAAYALRSFPRKVWGFIERRYTSFISLDQGQEPLEWMLVWLGNTEYGKNTRRLTVTNNNELTIGEGMHWFVRDKRLVLVSYNRSYFESDGVPLGRKEEIRVRIIPGDRELLETILGEAKEQHKKSMSGKTYVYMPDAWGSGWNGCDILAKRSFESVVLTETNESAIRKRLERFSSSKEQCRELGLPWRLSFLLHGTPGNGKSSMASVIASEMNYHLYVLNLNGISSDKHLLSLCSQIGEDALLLIEDIDAYNVDRDNEKSKDGITLSGLLNALDGITAKNGRITIMTTNDPDSLDPALIRKGRADCHVKFEKPVADQLSRLYTRFGQIYDGREFENMAEAQDYLLNEEETCLKESLPHLS